MTLHAEGQVGHHPGGGQDVHRRGGEDLGLVAGEGHGQVEDQVRPGLQGRLGPAPGVQEGWLSSLYEAGGEDHDYGGTGHHLSRG